ncbi:hypothetical protein [Microbacterium rhizomatis]|uniref:Uncharacterized protein n=1 Tax=Microbacterium rhizomatis TaxID=1631477 RepID=A0A5J5J6N2_9MICO|nr:hypothetical protein [Microbacterium rhizomatis]KAA9110784.1 hypothetical protein F6B43_03860 [Microbacterium rhizomatis]
MNDLLGSVRSPGLERHRLLSHPPHLGPRPSLSDRLAMRIGLWLLLRGERRLRLGTDHTEHARLFANERAREVRERAFTGDHLLRQLRA